MSAEMPEISLINSPLGFLKIISEGNFITAVNFVDGEHESSIHPSNIHRQCITQLNEYFTGERKVFDFSFRQKGTEFQQKVWKELTEIPFGEKISYLELSKRIGDVKAIRAVGTTNGKNNLAIVVPCHRVIGSDGALTGYAGGLWRKEWLLKHELNFSPPKAGELF